MSVTRQYCSECSRCTNRNMEPEYYQPIQNALHYADHLWNNWQNEVMLNTHC